MRIRSLWAFGVLMLAVGAFGLSTAPGATSEGAVLDDRAAGDLWGGATYCPKVKGIGGCGLTVTCGTCSAETSYVSDANGESSGNSAGRGDCSVCGMNCGNVARVTGCGP